MLPTSGNDRWNGDTGELLTRFITANAKTFNKTFYVLMQYEMRKAVFRIINSAADLSTTDQIQSNANNKKSFPEKSKMF